MKTLLIANPVAGKGRALAAAHQVALAYPKTAPDLYLTRSAGDATLRTAKAVDEGYECVVAIGGDGTVNEVAQALVHTQVALGIIPVGSGNGLARHLGYAMQPVQAYRQLSKGQVQRIDYGLVNGKPFFTTFGLGFDGAVAKAFAERGGNRGLARYMALSLSLYNRFVPFQAQLQIDTEAPILLENAFSLTFGNANQFGNNFRICPAASLADGLLDLTAITHQGLYANVQLMARILRQKPFETLAMQKKLMRCQVVCQSPIPYHADGEYMTTAKEFTVSIVPKSLNVIGSM